jgi:hypothetical protein
MEIILAIVGLTFAGFCIRSVVRVVNQPQGWQAQLGRLLGVGVCLAVVGAFLLPTVQRSRESSPRSQCENNLKQIGLALHTYHDQYDCFPPAFVADAKGRPMHSWRVFLLPYLNQGPLYAQYRFDEPWDGPNNGKLADKLVAAYNCPSDKRGNGKNAATMTSYVAVVGPETMWPEDSTTGIRDIKDGTTTTLMIVEVANSGIHWMEPRDLHVVQMAPTINPKSGQGISSPHAGGAQVLMGDGTVRFISEQLTAETIRALLTAHAGEQIGDF